MRAFLAIIVLLWMADEIYILTDRETLDSVSSPDAGKSLPTGQLSPREIKREAASTSISSLSPSSHVISPTAAAPPIKAASEAASPASVDSLAEHQPAPAPAVPQYQTFGPDPSTFYDPTIYHIRDVTPGMTEDEIKEIYCVAGYPHDDLHDLVPGTPPDRDLSNAKPPSQTNASTFATYVEPYFRQITEEDLAFLRERVRACPPYIRHVQLLTWYRAIALKLFSSLVEARGIIQRFGPRRMELYP